ncbi:MAG TPA: GNAT family N-acetyltransferase [Acidimicrobiia bacterium]|jgi:predicted N-acetyltransferase YhbS|nr:GNAT family N-acetyltransferase [Acidimicrobiia bacterium]
MHIIIRPIRESETQRFRSAIARGFGGDSREEDHDRFYEMLPLDRTVGAFDGDEIVGTLGEFDFAITVPGGAQLTMAGTTIVTVRATHRRRGILRDMMQLHLDAAHGRGDPLAGLWASETAIYGRFGFGLCADKHEIDLDTRHVPGQVAHCGPDLLRRLRHLHDRRRASGETAQGRTLGTEAAEARPSSVGHDVAHPGAPVVVAADDFPAPVGDRKAVLGEILGGQEAAREHIRQPNHRPVFVAEEQCELGSVDGIEAVRKRLLSHSDHMSHTQQPPFWGTALPSHGG